MQIKDYIQGNKHGKEANRLEREAMNDTFLQDALEGFDAVSGNHTEIIERLEKQIGSPAGVRKENRRILYFYAVAASVLLLVGFGIYFIWDQEEQEPVIAMVQSVASEETIESSRQESMLPPPPASENIEQLVPAASVAGAGIPPAQSLQTPVEQEDTKLDPQNEILAITEDDIQVVVSEDAQFQVFAQSIAPPVSKEDIIVEDMDLVAEAEYAVARRSIQSAARSQEKSADLMPPEATFGEKEFEAYCLKNAAKNICDSDSISVKVSFHIDTAGKPTHIKYDQYTCENAKNEIERLLDKSPVWTVVNQEITMTIKWK